MPLLRSQFWIDLLDRCCSRWWLTGGLVKALCVRRQLTGSLWTPVWKLSEVPEARVFFQFTGTTSHAHYFKS